MILRQCMTLFYNGGHVYITIVKTNKLRIGQQNKHDEAFIIPVVSNKMIKHKIKVIDDTRSKVMK